MAGTIVIRKPEYILTIRDLLIAFIESNNADLTPVWEKDGANNKITQMPIVKKLGVAPDVGSSKIFASGLTYDITKNTRGAQLTTDVVALPRDIEDKALGTTIISGSMAYSKNNDKGKEFAVGYYMEESSGGLVFFFHPRCQMIVGQSEYNTANDSDPDPQVSKAIEVLPTHEGVWRVRYATADAAVGKVPLTLAQFFGALPYTIAEIEALVATEAAAGG